MPKVEIIKANNLIAEEINTDKKLKIKINRKEEENDTLRRAY